MNDTSQYQGIVTIKFYDKDKNLKSIIKQHNTATPYFFYILESLLKNNPPKTSKQDVRPGKLALTAQVGDSNKGNKLSNLFLHLIPFEAIYLSKDLTSVEQTIDPKNPFIRFEFNISYYDLINPNGIENLSGYRFWLLSRNSDTFPSELTLTEEDDISGTLEEITYKSSAKKGNGICAQVQILDDDSDTDTNYSLNKGELITVLWDMYFKNNGTEE